MIRNYFYNQQLKKFIIGFSNVFAGMQVFGGYDNSGPPNKIMMEVPIRYGSTDRVTAAMAAGNTQNKLHTIPMMSCYMTNLDLAPDRLHGVNQIDHRTYLEQGGIFPNDVKSITRVMPIPYNMQLELAIYASNTDQIFQIIEQILILFDYDLQLEFNDTAFDWAKITKIYLRSLQNEENYPMGADRRMIIWTLQFEMPIWMSPPIEVRNDLIQSIQIRIGDLDTLTLDEIDQNGELVPFGTTYAQFSIGGTSTTTVINPGAISMTISDIYGITIGTDIIIPGAGANGNQLSVNVTGIIPDVTPVGTKAGTIDFLPGIVTEVPVGTIVKWTANTI
jgi:hypothetical protein